MSRETVRDLSGAVKYKIHSLTSVGGVAKSANNNVFYNSYEEAADKCREYLRQPSSCDGYVIMKTCAVIERASTPVAEYILVDGGIEHEEGDMLILANIR